MTKFSLKLSLCALVVAASAQAAPYWEKVLSCDGGSAVLDAQDHVIYGDNHFHYKYQLVVRNEEINRYLARAGAFDKLPTALRNFPREIIIGELHSNNGHRVPEEAFMSDNVTAPTRLITATRRDGGLHLQIFEVTLDGALRPRPSHRIADWFFSNCE